jgi:hypothetical protein
MSAMPGRGRAREQNCVEAEALFQWLVQDVLLHNGETAFSKEDSQAQVHDLVRSDAASQMGKALEGEQGDPLSGLELTLSPSSPRSASPVELAIMALRVLAPRRELHFDDAVAQILWRHRREEVLQCGRYKKIAEDMAWMLPLSGPKPKGEASIRQGLANTFRSLSIANSGKIDSRHWHHVAHILKSDIFLHSQLKISDLDRLFWSGTHINGGVTQTLTTREFKELLAQLAETMHVHPYQIFQTLGNYGNYQCSAIQGA